MCVLLTACLSHAEWPLSPLVMDCDANLLQQLTTSLSVLGWKDTERKSCSLFTLPFSYLPSFSLFPPFPQPSVPSFPSSPLLLWCCLLSINLLSCFCHFYLCLPSLSLCMNLFLFCFSESLFHVLNLQLPSTLSFLSVCLAFISIPFYTFFAFPPLSVQPDSNCGISHNHKKQEIKERERRWQCGKRP